MVLLLTECNMTRTEYNLMLKLADGGVSKDTLERLYGTAPTTEPKWMIHDYDLHPEGKLERKPGFLSRNQWMYRFLLNPLNSQFGTGTRLFQYSTTF